MLFHNSQIIKYQKTSDKDTNNFLNSQIINKKSVLLIRYRFCCCFRIASQAMAMRYMAVDMTLRALVSDDNNAMAAIAGHRAAIWIGHT